MIVLKGVNKFFGKKHVLKDINLTIETGETLAIIGGSGSGKSTLLKLLIGLEQASDGEIWIDGNKVSDFSEEEFDQVRLHMGMVFQYSALFDSMTVGENVAFGLREHTSKSKEEITDIVAKKLEQVGLPGVESMMPGELSGGMKKRVGLARAIAFDPDILFYDEPSSGLDPVTTEKIDELIIATQKRMRVTSIVVTHDMTSACHVADRIAMLYQGELIAVEPTERFRRLKDERIKAFLRDMHIEEDLADV